METTHVQGGLWALDSVQLGRFVLNPKKPNTDFIDPLADRLAPTEFLKEVQTNFEETRRFSRSSNIRPYLSNILSISYEKQNDSSATLRAPQATSYDLKCSGAWLRLACAEPKIVQFLETAFDREQTVYLVVGFRTVENGIRAVSMKDPGIRYEASVRRATGLAGASLAVNIPTSGIRSSYGAGEQIFAVLYRKVKFTWLSSKSTPDMSLELGHRWLPIWDWRGLEDEDVDEDDILEATLTDLSDQDISDEEYISEDETEYFHEVPSSATSTEETVEDIHGTTECGVKLKELDNEDDASNPREEPSGSSSTKEIDYPREQTSSLPRIEEITRWIYETTRANVKSRDRFHGVLERLMIELCHTLLVFIFLCGVFSIFFGNPFKRK